MNALEYQDFVISKEADQEEIRERVYRLGIQATRLDNATRGLANDAGEVLDCVKDWLEYGKPLDRDHLLEELGDVMFRVVQSAAAVQSNLVEVMERNVRKLNERYKKGFTNEEAANRDRDREKAAMVEAIAATDPKLGERFINCTVPVHEVRIYRDGNSVRAYRGDGKKTVVYKTETKPGGVVCDEEVCEMAEDQVVSLDQAKEFLGEHPCLDYLDRFCNGE